MAKVGLSCQVKKEAKKRVVYFEPSLCDRNKVRQVSLFVDYPMLNMYFFLYENQNYSYVCGQNKRPFILDKPLRLLK
jgi:hypothetical protein